MKIKVSHKSSLDYRCGVGIIISLLGNVEKLFSGGDAYYIYTPNSAPYMIRGRR